MRSFSTFDSSFVQVDPYESREDPLVCAALIEANAYVDLDDVLNDERIFWKVKSNHFLMSSFEERHTL